MNMTLFVVAAIVFAINTAILTRIARPTHNWKARLRWAAANLGTEWGLVNLATVEEQVTKLKDDRAGHLDVMDEIVRTAKEQEREITNDEETRYSAARAEVERVDTELDELLESVRKAQLLAGHDALIARSVPKINLITDPPAAVGRSLDELLWATAEDVQAGSFQRNGQFVPNPYGARNAVEQITVRDQDHDLVDAPRIVDFRLDDQPKVRQFQRAVADMILFGMMVDRNARSSRDGFLAARTHKGMRSRFEHALRALDVDTAGEGGNWVPTGIGADLHEKVRAAGRVAPLFARIDLPTNPWKFPLEGADAVAYRVPEPTSDTATKVAASTPGTNGATFDAEIFGGRILLSKSIEADSAIAILPHVRNKLVRAFLDAEEKGIIDGDTDGTHQDSDVGASTTDARTAWDGLRKRGLANASLNGASATVTLALLRSLRALMGKWGLNPADIAIIASIGAYYDLLATSDVTTVDKMGSRAVILNGQLGAVDGSPIIVTEHFREDLNASGVYDGVTTTQTGLVVVNRGEWAMGQRMALDVETDDSIYRETYQRVLVGFMREDFQSIGESTGDDTAYLYNID